MGRAARPATRLVQEDSLRHRGRKRGGEDPRPGEGRQGGHRRLLPQRRGVARLPRAKARRRNARRGRKDKLQAGHLPRRGLDAPRHVRQDDGLPLPDHLQRRRLRPQVPEAPRREARGEGGGDTDSAAEAGGVAKARRPRRPVPLLQQQVDTGVRLQQQVHGAHAERDLGGHT